MIEINALQPGHHLLIKFLCFLFSVARSYKRYSYEMNNISITGKMYFDNLCKIINNISNDMKLKLHKTL